MNMHISGRILLIIPDTLHGKCSIPIVYNFLTTDQVDAEELRLRNTDYNRLRREGAISHPRIYLVRPGSFEALKDVVVNTAGASVSYPVQESPEAAVSPHAGPYDETGGRQIKFIHLQTFFAPLKIGTNSGTVWNAYLHFKGTV